MSLDFSALKDYIDDAARTELLAQGFPDYMIYSFIQTAAETNTIVSSRLPGPAGQDLIQAGYDLKGFQIKAKSCDWGPMGGFICQLPLFNKYGFDKVDYNAGFIAHYLVALVHFKGVNRAIKLINAQRKTDLGSIQNNDPNAKKNRETTNKKYDAQIVEKINTYKQSEQTGGEWSGENSLPDDDSPQIPVVPFIHLKREFGDDPKTMLRTFKGVSAASLSNIDAKTVYGIATNDTFTTSAATNKATVFVEFLLVQEADTKIWGIYHGRIFFKKAAADANMNLFDPGNYVGILGDEIKEEYPFAQTAKVTAQTAANNKTIFDRIFKFATTPNSVTKTTVAGIPANFTAGEQVFFPVQGFMNPHPPYPKTSNEFYKNAVSGDYDLFAFWPNIPAVNVHELTRISELKIGKQLRIGGKILTTYLGDKANLGIEFIPGFKELNPAKAADGTIIPGEELKESAEIGNISNWGQTVAEALNAFAVATYFAEYKKDFPEKTQMIFANEAFHSDEGGRPGVMEIEFPIAVFFPKKFGSVALNNLYITANGNNTVVPPFKNRVVKYTYGGLIKTVEEFLQLMLECQEAIYESLQRKDPNKPNDPPPPPIKVKNNFLVMMHSEWMMHLFFLSLPQADRVNFLKKEGDTYSAISNQFNTEPVKKIDKKIGEFKKIQDHVNADFNQPEFEKSLMKLVLSIPLVLSVPGTAARDTPEINLEYFNKLRKRFLILAFQGSRLAYARKLDVDQLLESYHRLYQAYLAE